MMQSTQNFKRLSGHSTSRRCNGERNHPKNQAGCQCCRGIEYAIISWTGIWSHLSGIGLLIVGIYGSVKSPEIISAIVQQISGQQGATNQQIAQGRREAEALVHKILIIFWIVASVMLIYFFINAQAMYNMVNRRFSDQPDSKRFWFRLHYWGNLVFIVLQQVLFLGAMCFLQFYGRSQMEEIAKQQTDPRIAEAVRAQIPSAGAAAGEACKGYALWVIMSAAAIFMNVLTLWASRIAGAQFEESRVTRMGAAQRSNRGSTRNSRSVVGGPMSPSNNVMYTNPNMANYGAAQAYPAMPVQGVPMYAPAPVQGSNLV